jgi:hypothetical protein
MRQWTRRFDLLQGNRDGFELKETYPYRQVQLIFFIFQHHNAVLIDQAHSYTVDDTLSNFAHIHSLNFNDN